MRKSMILLERTVFLWQSEASEGIVSQQIWVTPPKIFSFSKNEESMTRHFDIPKQALEPGLFISTGWCLSKRLTPKFLRFAC